MATTLTLAEQIKGLMDEHRHLTNGDGYAFGGKWSDCAAGDWTSYTGTWSTEDRFGHQNHLAEVIAKFVETRDGETNE